MDNNEEYYSMENTLAVLYGLIDDIGSITAMETAKSKVMDSYTFFIWKGGKNGNDDDDNVGGQPISPVEPIPLTPQFEEFEA